MPTRRFLSAPIISALLFSVGFGCVNADEIAPAKPQRVISINVCLDPLLLKLVEPERINSLYYLSANPQFSPFAEQANKFYLNHGLAEDIVPRNPDLVVAGEYTSLDLKTLLKNLGFRVETLALPRTLSDISAHIRKFGQLTNSEIAAEKMAQALEQKLLQLDASQKNTKPVPAFWYSSNGVVIGSDTLENELMTRAGFHNLALDKHIVGFAQIELEELILAQPKVLIVDASDVQAFSLAQEYVNHPALRANKMRIIRLPTTLSCIAPVAAEAIENLMQQRQALSF